MSQAVEVPTPSEESELPLARVDVRRVLGHVKGASAGPTLVCVGGIHGNEPAGVIALAEVVEQLRSDPSRVQGEFVALAGNIGALKRDRRYIDRDLNRAWTEERVELLRSGGSTTTAEDAEQRELLLELDKIRERTRGPIWVMDLHTTSGPGGVFTTVSDRLPNREFALGIPVPLVLGLEEQVEGTLMDYMDREGLVAISFESGQHREERAVERAVQGIWLCLARAGVVSADLAEVQAAASAFDDEFEELPEVVEIRFRLGLEERPGFQMLEGYQSFQQVHAGELLGHDDEGDVHAPRSGRILMPLYQVQGDDGFFIVRKVNAFWLSVSKRMRRWRLDRFVHFLPGVRRVEARPGALYVNRRLARWFATELLHLLGYRRVRDVGKRLIVIERGALPSDRKT